MNSIKHMQNQVFNYSEKISEELNGSSASAKPLIK